MRASYGEKGCSADWLTLSSELSVAGNSMRYKGLTLEWYSEKQQYQWMKGIASYSWSWIVHITCGVQKSNIIGANHWEGVRQCKHTL